MTQRDVRGGHRCIDHQWVDGACGVCHEREPEDGEVIRLDHDGMVVCWDTDNHCEYNTGETPEDFGLDQMTEEERGRIEKDVPIQ